MSIERQAFNNSGDGRQQECAPEGLTALTSEQTVGIAPDASQPALDVAKQLGEAQTKAQGEYLEHG